MYNLGEKKAFINDLAAKLLGGDAILGTVHHHHHRNLTAEIISLEDLVLFKIQAFRLQFLAKCLQLHALSGKNQLVLPITHFELLTDVLRVILREANNEQDYLSMRMLYLVSELTGTYLGHGGQGGHLCLRSLKAALSKHEAWQNLFFYQSVLDECVARDKQHWMHLQGPLQEVLFCEIRNEEIITLLLSFRLKAMARAILQLRAPMSLIDGLLMHCRRMHGVEFERGEVFEPLETPSMLWLLDVAVRAWHLPGLADQGGEAKEGLMEEWDASRSSSSNASRRTSSMVGGGAEAYVEMLRRRSSLSSMACITTAKSSVSNVVRWALEMTGRATHGASLGFSVHHELFRFVLDRLVANPQQINLLARVLPSTSTSSSTSTTTTTSSSSSSSNATCLCGRPCKAWKVLGGYGEQLENIRRYLPLLLCEGCFRTVVHNQGLEVLRLQQTVGMATLPASEIRTPASIAAFVIPGPRAKLHQQHQQQQLQQLQQQREGWEGKMEKRREEEERTGAGPPRRISSSSSSSDVSRSAAGVASPAVTQRMPTIHSIRSSSSRLSSSSSSRKAPSLSQQQQQLAPGPRRRSEDNDVSSFSKSSSSSLAGPAATGAGAGSSPYQSSSSRGHRSSSVSSTSFSHSASPSSSAYPSNGNGGGGTVRRYEAPPPSRRLSSSSSVSIPSSLSSSSSPLPGIARATHRSSSGSIAAAPAMVARRREESKHAALLREEGMEVLKHGRFGCVVPHYRYLFVDREEVFWCRREEVGKRKRQKAGARGGLLLRNLLQVKLKKGARVVCLTFKERPLIVEALADEDFDVLASVFTRVMNENMYEDRAPVVISRGKRY